MNIEKKMLEEIQRLHEKLSDMDPATDEYKAVEDAMLKLIDRAATMEEQDLKRNQMSDDRKERKWDRAIRIAGIATPPVVALVAACIFSVVERTEIVSTSATREFIRRAMRLS